MDSKLTDLVLAFLHDLNKPVRLELLADLTNIDNQTISNILADLIKDGTVSTNDDGYLLTSNVLTKQEISTAIADSLWEDLYG